MKIHGTTSDEKRRDKRLTSRPLSVEIDGALYVTESWSLSGFLIGDYQGHRMPGDRLAVRIVFRDGPPSVDMWVDVRIVRVERGAGTLAAGFVDLGDDAYDLLEGWMSGSLGRALRST